MEEKRLTLEEILEAVSVNKNGVAKRRLMFDQGKVGGISLKWVILFFFLLPALLYAGIFNPAVFDMLGIAQAIIFFVVFLSMLMIMIFALAFINNNSTLRRIKSSWESYFPEVDIKQVLSSGATPYRDFFQHYSEALQKGLSGKELHHFLQKAFETMSEENKELLEAMNRQK